MNFKRFYKLINENTMPDKFYHGSMIELPVGTILKPNDNYEGNWSNTDFYEVLERYRPKGMLSHKNSVFMCGNDEDVDLAGGGTEYLFIVNPIGKIEKHDVNWSSEISGLISEGLKIDDPRVIDAANNYWSGNPHYNEQLWEYLTPLAKIISVKEY
jgi:hypothetical protein